MRETGREMAKCMRSSLNEVLNAAGFVPPAAPQASLVTGVAPAPGFAPLAVPQAAAAGTAVIPTLAPQLAPTAAELAAWRSSVDYQRVVAQVLTQGDHVFLWPRLCLLFLLLRRRVWWQVLLRLCLFRRLRLL